MTASAVESGFIYSLWSFRYFEFGLTVADCHIINSFMFNHAACFCFTVNGDSDHLCIDLESRGSGLVTSFVCVRELVYRFPCSMNTCFLPHLSASLESYMLSQHSWDFCRIPPCRCHHNPLVSFCVCLPRWLFWCIWWTPPISLEYISSEIRGNETMPRQVLNVTVGETVWP